MTGWTSDELARIAAADELEIETRRADGTLRKAVPVWVVRHDAELYVRSYKGGGAAWFRAVQALPEEHVRADGVAKDVTFAAVVEDEVNEHVDAAYRAKYGRYGESYITSILSAQSRAATLKVVPKVTAVS